VFEDWIKCGKVRVCGIWVLRGDYIMGLDKGREGEGLG